MLFLECETFFFGTASRIPSHNEPSPQPEDSDAEEEGRELGDAVANDGVSADNDGVDEEEAELKMAGTRNCSSVEEPRRSVNWSWVAALRVIVGSMLCMRVRSSDRVCAEPKEGGDVGVGEVMVTRRVGR